MRGIHRTKVVLTQAVRAIHYGIMSIRDQIMRAWQRSIGPLLSGIVKIYGALFLFSVSVLVLLRVTGLLGENIVERIGTDTLLGVLTLLVAFAGLLAYIYKTEIRRELKDEYRDLVEEERSASRIETKLAVGFAFWHLYQSFDRREHFLSLALKSAEQAFKSIQELRSDEYTGIGYQVKNDLAYYLAEKRVDKHRALALQNELMAIIQSGRIPTTIRHDPYVEWTETCAWVLYRFGGPAAIAEAREIIIGLKHRVDGDQFDLLKKKYELSATA